MTKDEMQRECEQCVEDCLHARFDVGVGNIDAEEWNEKVAAKNTAFDAYAHAAVEAALADTLGMQTSLSQMLYWATCYSLDCKHSKFMSTHRKTLMEREIAEAEALLKETPNDKG